jgi:hypothetical protein
MGKSADPIREALIDRAEDLFRAAWGEPEKPGAKDWRAQSSSARSMVMRGAKRGQWFDHKAGTGGDVLDFFAAEFMGLTAAAKDFSRVIDEAAIWCGLSIDQAPEVSMARRAAREAQATADDASATLRKATLVRALQARCEALAGSPAAAYLAARGITSLPPGWHYLPPVSLAVRNSKLGALFVPAIDDSGAVKGGQRILILADGSKAQVDPRKPSFGVIGGFPARIPATIPGGPLVICEGPETSAAIAQATGFETWAVFGVAGFQAAPAPIGRKVVFCPDQDAPGSDAAKAFDAAVVAHVARGVDVWIARAPEDEGSKRDLNDTLQRAGADAVMAAVVKAVKFTPRDGKGRFTGGGVIESAPAQMPDFVSVETARRLIPEAVKTWLAKAVAWDTESPAPVTAIAASPGAGKSVGARGVLAGLDLSTLAGDVVFYAPTLALADEAAAHAKSLGAGSHVTRGRSAINPATQSLMCDRAELAELVAGAGLSVKATLCKRIEGGQEYLCPFYQTCAYRQQWNGLGSAPVLRFEAHSYLTLPGDGSERPTARRVIDESIWRQSAGQVDLAFDAWLKPRKTKAWKTSAERDAAEGDAADVTKAALDVLTALQMGGSLQYTAEDFERFAKAESGSDVLNARPDADEKKLMAEVLAHAKINAGARKRAAVWRVLADCKGATERLRIVLDQPASGSKEKRDVLRVHWFTAPKRDVPVLLLDADITPEILERLYPGADLMRFDLRPNAEVLQLTDKTFSNDSLTRKEVRREAIELVRAEVYRDKLSGARGVLAVATKKAVRAIFEDAGHKFTGKSETEIAALMIETSLHGARWLWFGPASLGRNDWESFGTAVVIGREELPTAVVEDYARGFWGDSDKPLQFVQADEAGRINLPEVLLPVTMADGSGAAIRARAHPDPRIRALHLQTREMATRQCFERLRLATAPERKRVILANKIPVPGLPVDRLLTWDEMKPTRLESAMAEAAERGGVLRLSARGLSMDAPETFLSEQAAKGWLESFDLGKLNTPPPLIEGLITGGGVFKAVRVLLRIQGQRGKATPALVVLPGDFRAMAEAKLGPLAEFELLQPTGALPGNEGVQILQPIPAPQQARRLVILPKAPRSFAFLQRQPLRRYVIKAPLRYDRDALLKRLVNGLHNVLQPVPLLC